MMIRLLLFIFLCSAIQAQKTAELPAPVVFAQYANAQNVHGPTPQLATIEPTLSTKPKSPWQLVSTPEYFVWEQTLKAGQRLVVELIDSEGLPWPFSSSIWHKGDTWTIRLKPDYALAKAKTFFLTGSVFDNDSKKLEIRTTLLTVTQGLEGAPPWRVAPAVKTKTIPKKTSRRR